MNIFRVNIFFIFIWKYVQYVAYFAGVSDFFEVAGVTLIVYLSDGVKKVSGAITHIRGRERTNLRRRVNSEPGAVHPTQYESSVGRIL